MPINFCWFSIRKEIYLRRLIAYLSVYYNFLKDADTLNDKCTTVCYQAQRVSLINSVHHIESACNTWSAKGQAVPSHKGLGSIRYALIINPHFNQQIMVALLAYQFVDRTYMCPSVDFLYIIAYYLELKSFILVLIGNRQQNHRTSVGKPTN